MIEILRRIAELDEKVCEVTKRLEPFRARLAAIRARAATASASAKDTAARLATARKTERSLGIDLAELEEKLRAERKKLDAIQSMKAAQAFEHELAALESKKVALEEKMLASMEEEEALEVSFIAADSDAKAALAEAAEIEAEVAAAEDEGKERINLLETEKSTVAAALSPEWSKRYLALVAAKLTGVIATATDTGCPGCRMALRPNAIAHLHVGHPTICDHCKRILLPQ